MKSHTHIYIYMYIYIYVIIFIYIYIYDMNLKACGPRVGFWRPIFQVQGWAFSMSSLQLLVCTTLVVWVSLPTSQEGVPRPSKYQQNTGKRIKIMGWNTILCVLGGSSYTYIYIYIYTCIDTYKVYYTYTYIYIYILCIHVHVHMYTQMHSSAPVQGSTSTNNFSRYSSSCSWLVPPMRRTILQSSPHKPWAWFLQWHSIPTLKGNIPAQQRAIPLAPKYFI